MNRRTFLRAAAVLPAAAPLRVPGFGSIARAEDKEFKPQPGTWRTFEITTRVEVLRPAGGARVWLPIPVVKSDSQTPIENNWSGNAKVMQALSDPKYGAGMLYAEFTEGEAAPTVELIN